MTVHPITATTPMQHAAFIVMLGIAHKEVTVEADAHGTLFIYIKAADLAAFLHAAKVVANTPEVYGTQKAKAANAIVAALNAHISAKVILEAM